MNVPVAPPPINGPMAGEGGPAKVSDFSASFLIF